MRNFAVFALCVSLGLSRLFGADPADDVAQSTLVKAGDTAPLITGTDTNGVEWSLASEHGKVVLLCFFATWCGPCNEELPHIDKELWAALKDKGLVVVAVGREHTVAELVAFKAKKKLSLPMVADPKRSLYAPYASKYIPRCFLIGKNGKVVLSTADYNPETFPKLIAAVKAELAR